MIFYRFRGPLFGARFGSQNSTPAKNLLRLVPQKWVPNLDSKLAPRSSQKIKVQQNFLIYSLPTSVLRSKRIFYGALQGLIRKCWPINLFRRYRQPEPPSFCTRWLLCCFGFLKVKKKRGKKPSCCNCVCCFEQQQLEQQ